MTPLADARLTLAPLTNFDVAALAAAAASYTAYRAHLLTGGGALAAFVVGTSAYGALGTPGAAILIVFFATSVALSALGRGRKRELDDVVKAGARDGAQVLANGGIATLCALLSLGGDPRYAVAFAGAYAAANADTWGTEIGTLAKGPPRSILTLRPIARGLSGGVTLLGLLAECAGAALIGGVAVTLVGHAAWAVFAGGCAGAIVDSVLGASLQALRWCPQCRRASESDPHSCGANTTLVRGAAWFGNDVVNAVATVTGAAIAFVAAG